jgi:hypothetical protein
MEVSVKLPSSLGAIGEKLRSSIRHSLWMGVTMPPRKIKHNPLLLREEGRLQRIVAEELAEYQSVHGVKHLHFRINKKG